MKARERIARTAHAHDGAYADAGIVGTHVREDGLQDETDDDAREDDGEEQGDADVIPSEKDDEDDAEHDPNEPVVTECRYERGKLRENGKAQRLKSEEYGGFHRDPILPFSRSSA